MSPRQEAFVSPEAAEVLAAHANFLNEAMDVFADWNDEHGWVATERSPSEAERQTICRHFGPAGDWAGDSSQNITGIVSLLLGVSTQYLEAIRALLEAHQVIASLPPLVRASFEASCRITWVIAPLKTTGLGRTTARPRVARAVLVQLEDYSRLKAAAVALGLPQATQYGGSWRKLRSKTIPGLFYESEIVLEKNGDLTICGQSLPGFREATVEFEKVHHLDWKAGGVYDFLSNAAHPTPHMVMNATKLQPNGKVRFEIEGTSSVTRQVKVAVLAFLLSWRRTAGYLGLPFDSIEKLLTRVDSLPE